MRKNMLGVTLIELMVVIVVLAVLASIAVPSYRRYMIRSNRTEATAALLQMQTAQEKFFLQNNRYATDDEIADGPPDGLGLPTTTQSGYYDISLADGLPTNQFRATAVPAADRGQKDDDACTSMTIDESGVKASGPSATSVCWK